MRQLLVYILFAFIVNPVISQPTLFGVSAQGGKDDAGTLFTVVPSSGGATASLKKQFYTDGLLPNNSAPVMLDGVFYGVTQIGGVNNTGTIFSYNPVTSSYSKIFDFFGTRGEQPYGSLVVYNGLLYGMAYGGGANGNGVVFSFNPQTASFAKLYDFAGVNGAYPYSSLTFANGRFYGTTISGGMYNLGVIFSFDATTPEADLTVEYNFGLLNPSNLGTGDAALPYGNLIQASDGNLYGVTKQGGANGLGAVYSLNIATSPSTYSLLAPFENSLGGSPVGGLLELNNIL